MIRFGSRHGARPRPTPVDVALVGRLGFTDHAIERFASRAGFDTTNRAVLAPVIRGLLLREGWIVPGRPAWSPSSNRADLYLQLGEWMLLIGCRDQHDDRRISIVTIVNRPTARNWQEAWSRGYVQTPAPIPSHLRTPSRLVSIALALIGPARDAGIISPSAIHRQRRTDLRRAYEQEVVQRWQGHATDRRSGWT